MPRHRSVLICTAIAALLTCRDASAIKVSPPPSREYVAQTWVGFSTDDLYTIRINLNADGTGTGVLILSTEAPEPFDVRTWTLDQDSLVVSVRFHSRKRSVSRIEGSFKQHLLSYTSGMLDHPERLSEHWLPGPLELSFKDGSGRARFGAWPEHELDERLHRVKDVSSSSKPGGA